MTRAEQQFDLCRRLVAMAGDLCATRATVLSDDAIRVLRDQVTAARRVLLDDDEVRLIGYEAACLVEVMVELTFARAEKCKAREDRAVAYLNMIRLMMLTDLNRAKQVLQ